MAVKLKKAVKKKPSKKNTAQENLDLFLDDIVDDPKSKIVRMSKIKDSIIVPMNMVSYNRASVVGGLVTGGSYSLCGKSQGGKTLFGVLGCYAFAKLGYPSLYLDAERTGDKEWFVDLGMNLKKGAYLVPNTLEHASEEVDKFIKKLVSFKKKIKGPFPALIVGDSYNKIRPSEELKNAIVKGRQYPLHAAMFTDWMNKLTSLLYENDAIFMTVRHDRANMNKKNKFEPDTVSSGAQTLNHDSTMTIRFDMSSRDTVSYTLNGTERKRIVGYWHQFVVEKSKDGIKEERGKFYISNGKGHVPKGYCQYETAIEEALYQETITKTKGRYTINDTGECFDNRQSLWEALSSDTNMYESFAAQLAPEVYWNRKKE